MDLVQQSFGITAVFVLLGILLWWLKRGGAATMRSHLYPAAKREMEIVERLPLTAQHSIQLVRVRNRMLLIGVSPGGLSLIHHISGVTNATEKEIER